MLHHTDIRTRTKYVAYVFQKFERVYHEQLRSSFVTQQAQFEYAWCLVRSKYPADIQKGIILLEDLYCNHSDSEKRDCLYYLAIGNARIKVQLCKPARCFPWIKHRFIECSVRRSIRKP